MVDHPLSKFIEKFDLRSYYAGVNMTFAEVVGAGCKKLAISSLYDHELAEEMIPPTEYAADEYHVKLMVEPDLIVTKLFPCEIAKNKTVILIAHDQSVLDEYLKLKKLKEKSNKKGNPEKFEREIAYRFGKLLSYDKETINRLLASNS